MMNNTRAQPLAPEWSVVVPAEDVGDSPVHMVIEANEDERAAIARRLGIVAVDSLKADLTLARAQDRRVVHVMGTLRAAVRQNCVVTLEPAESGVEEAFEGWFADPEQAVSFARARRDRLKLKAGIDVPILEEHEDPEPMTGGGVDVGELVVQNLSLAIPPYPHSDHAGQDENRKKISQDDRPPLRKNPFEALRYWKARQENADN
jgi:uncharacterized metal-binding protein YceD (DUF177 family)